MNFRMLILPWLFLILVPLSTTANVSLASKRTPEPGKDFYTVFPKESTDVSATVDFIKSTIQNHDLHPCTDVSEKLISWTVEASPSEVAKLDVYDGIVRVVKFEIPAHQGKRRRRDNTAIEGRFTIYPMDFNNQDQCKTTSASLEALLNDKVRERHMYDMIESWSAELTLDQVEQVKGIDGVKSVCRVHRGRRGCMIRGLTKPSTSPKLSSPL